MNNNAGRYEHDEEKDCNFTTTGVPDSSSVDLEHTTPYEKQPFLFREERSDVDSAGANAAGDAAAVPHFAARRRQPPPPPTPSTATKKSPSSSSAMRPGLDSEESTSASSGGSSPCRRKAVGQQNIPSITQGTFTTFATPAKAVRAVEQYSTSAFAPDRSGNPSTGSSSTCGGARDGNDNATRISENSACDPAHTMRSNGDEMCALSLQPPTVVEYSSRPEEAATSESVGSAIMPPTWGTKDDAVGDGRSEGVTTVDSVLDLKERLPYHDLKPMPTSEVHGETTRAADHTERGTRDAASASRATATLMPPSPSQPGEAAMADNRCCSSPACGGATAGELLRQSDHVNGGQRTSAAGRDGVAQLSEGDLVRRTLVMRCMQDSSTSSSFLSSKGVGGHKKEQNHALHNPGTGVASSAQTSIEKEEDGNNRPLSPTSSALCINTVCAKNILATRTTALQIIGALDGGNVGKNQATEECEEEGTLMNWDGTEEQEGNPLVLQESGRWDDVLKEMEIVDCTVVSRVYERAMPLQRSASDSDGDELCLFKTISLFPIATQHSERWGRRAEVQKRSLALAGKMRATQRALSEAGLTATGAELGSSVSEKVVTSENTVTQDERVGVCEEDSGQLFAQRRRRTTCAGVSEVFVDSRCRLIAELEAVPYMVPLRHFIAANSGAALREKEVLALIRTVVCKAATMHHAGFVHGALHAGNVLLSSYDGDAVLTQPCGLMSQSIWLPSDFSIISVARADAMAPYLCRVWGAHRLQMDGATSTRLAPPLPPKTDELITNHNLAALGWLDDDDSLNVGGSHDRGDSAELCRAGAAYTPTAADDLHAVGMIAFLIYIGVPPFQMASLWAAVERLRALGASYRTAMQSSVSLAAGRQEARRLVTEFCFGTQRRGTDANGSHRHGDEDASRSSGESVWEHGIARFRPDFEKALQSFIVDCVEASCHATTLKQASGPPYESGAEPHVYTNAQELLTRHPLFRHFSLTELDGHEDNGECGNGGGVQFASYEESQLSLDEKMRDTVHRLAYPAFCTWTRARQDCGSVPYLSRLHSNALFSARCTALCEIVPPAVRSHNHVDSESQIAFKEGESCSLLSVIRPHVAGVLQAWPFPFPSMGRGTSCLNSHGTDAAEVRCLPSLLRPSASAAPAWLAVSGDGDGDADSDASAATLAQKQENALAAQIFSDEQREADSDFVYRSYLHALTLTEKQESAFSLSRAFIVSRVLPVTDTLVLQHLADCTVTLLAPFRYIVLDGLQRCEVRLGPCESCVLRDVHECPLIAVAALQLSGNNVTETHLSWSRQGSGPPLLKHSRAVTVSLYGLMYEGLAEDYSKVGLALEHAPCFAATDDVNGDSDKADGAVTSRGSALTCSRTVELLSTTASSASQRLVEVGLCLAPEAPYDLALLLGNTRYVHNGMHYGGLRGPAMSPPDVFHFFGELAEKDVVVCDVHGGTRDGDIRPVVFLVGTLGDIVIERCSRCTILVVGTPGNLQASKCHDCQLIFMARESVIEDCARVDCVALVTEYLLVCRCEAARVRPLFLDCPFSDEVLQYVVNGSVGGDDEEMVLSAYEGGRLDELNAVLRGVGQGVLVEDSENVIIEDIHYYEHSGCSDDGEGEDRQSGADVDGLSVLSVAYASMKGPTAAPATSSRNTSQFLAEAAQSLAEQLSVPCYLEPLQRYGDAEGGVAAHAGRPTVSFHDLLNCSVLRLRGSLCPLESQASSTARDSTARLVDICVERVHSGVIYVEDAVHTLCLRHCMGPLDVVVCAATNVRMEACVGVQLRTACVDFQATDCAHCHVALHVNNPPQYQHCRSMQASALNITARDFHALLTAAGVDLATNLYDNPLLLTGDCQPTETARSLRASLDARGTYAFYGGSVDTPTAPHSTADMCAVLLSSVHREQRRQRQGGPLDGKFRVPPDQVSCIMTVLQQPVTVVAPLPGLCASPNETPFLEELEARVAEWAKRPLSVSREEAAAIALYALADLAEVYGSVTEWGDATDEVQPNEAPERGTAFSDCQNTDVRPHLLSTRASPLLSAAASASSTTGSVTGLALDTDEQKLPLTDRQLLQEAEDHSAKGGEFATEAGSAIALSCSSVGDTSRTQCPIRATTALVDVALGEQMPSTEHSVEEVVMHSRPPPPISSSLTCHTDSPRAPKACDAPTAPEEEPPTDSVAGHRPSESTISPRRAQHAKLCASEVPTLPCTVASTFASSAAGIDGAASGMEDETSVNSSVSAPPLPPGPAYALHPTSMNASSTMDVFYRTQRDATSMATGTTGPLMEEEDDACSLIAPTLDNEGARCPSASPWHDKKPSPVATDHYQTRGWSVGNGGNHEGARCEPQATPVTEVIGVLDGQAQVQFSPSLERSPNFIKSKESGSRNVDELVAAPTFACAKALPGVLVEEGNKPHDGRSVAHSSLPTSSSSVAEYPWRGVTSYESSSEYVVGGSKSGAGELTVQQTNFLHVSQDSSSRGLELNSHTAAMTPLMAMGSKEHDGVEEGRLSQMRGGVLKSPARGRALASNAEPLGRISAEVMLMDEVDANIKELLQTLEQARQLFAKNQRSLEEPPGTDLEVRVRSAEEKLVFLKLERAWDAKHPEARRR
ncbi:hypothetical protein, conserved [Leishmania tarentolae]|uniref:C-CAP/cofactor C-like domain-containing protein n=1 Tax=Leishmania tarentolae TaxID=5689 RepID=A0A640KFT5_LEITA|nr:hypothetical protein, conserved [Leishmania tarentolae]